MLTPQKRLQLAPATAGFILSGTLLLSASAQAFEFEAMDGEVQGTLNTTITLGAKYDLEGYETPESNEQLENDGDRSFKRGFVSKALKVTSELDVKKDNYGFFGRATAYYDHVLMNGKNYWWDNNEADNTARQGDPNWHDENGTFPGWSDEVKDNQGRGVKLQSAYIFADWQFDGGQKLSVKLGDQTHNWGETIFYGGGMMDLNAYDMALATVPGSDGDLNLAQGMLMADLQFNDQMTLSGFVQYDWEGSILPGRGTYGSGEDIFVPGSDFAHYDLAGLGAVPGVIDPNVYDGYIAGSNFIKVADVSGTTDARDSGQWGVRFKYQPESLKDTEFAIYYSNYHSSLPVIEALISDDATFKANALGQGALAGVYMLNQGTYARTAYAEDIKIWGASFNTKVFGYTQIAGEITYKENAPIWIDHPEDLLAKAYVQAGNILAGDGTWGASHADGNRTGVSGEWYKNYETTPVWDASLSVIQPFGAVLGTDLMYVVGEAAFEQVSGLDNYDQYVAKGSGDWASDNNGDLNIDDADKALDTKADERLDRFSWGYNMMLGANWNDVAMPGLNLESTFRFTHDVDGNSHMTGRFEEGEKKINMGLTAKYDDMMAKVTWGGDADNVLRKGTITGTVGYTF